MKKFTLILLLTMYTLSSMGIGIRQLYCCGHLESASFTVIEYSAAQCNDHHSMSGCCKTSFKSLTVKESHIPSIPFHAFYTPIIHSNLTDLFTCSFDESVSMNKINRSNAPPLNYGVPVYILYCVYRL